MLLDHVVKNMIHWLFKERRKKLLNESYMVERNPPSHRSLNNGKFLSRKGGRGGKSEMRLGATSEAQGLRTMERHHHIHLTS